MQQPKEQQSEKKELKFGITKEDEIKIHKEMIPTYIAI
jgi:hypothetical protein